MNRGPLARSDLRTQAMGTELLIYDAKADQIHILNETAWQVWQMCDGQHDEEEIATEMTRRYPDVADGQVREDTRRIIEDFRGKSLFAADQT